jgi:hypothetical protein
LVRDRWLVGRVPGDVAAPSPSPPCHWQRWVERGVSRRALDHIVTSTGTEARDEDIERLSPLGSDHITLTGRYRVLPPAPLHDRSAYRALNTPEDAAAA